MQNELAQTITLRACDCDAAGRWKPSAILLQMQELAEEHAAALGFARSYLVEQGMCWVLSRLAVQMDIYPQYGEEVLVTTWPTAIQGLYFPRHFRFARPDGTVLGCATTLWVLFGVENRRLLRPAQLPGEVPASAMEPPLPAPGKLHTAELAPAGSRKVCYSDLDLNGHMNNARYAEWLCDLADIETVCAQGLAAWQINYIAEGMPGEEIEFQCAQTQTGADVCGIKPGGKTMFEARFAYKQG